MVVLQVPLSMRAMPVQPDVSWPVPPYWAPMAVAPQVPEVIVPNLVMLSWIAVGRVVVDDIVPVSEKYIILPEPTELKSWPVPPYLGAMAVPCQVPLSIIPRVEVPVTPKVPLTSKVYWGEVVAMPMLVPDW